MKSILENHYLLTSFGENEQIFVIGHRSLPVRLLRERQVPQQKYSPFCFTITGFWKRRSLRYFVMF